MTKNDTTKRLAEIRKREQVATKGPWHSGYTADGVFSEERFICDARELVDEFFIAEARQDIPFLLDLMKWLVYEHDCKCSILRPCDNCAKMEAIKEALPQ